MRILFLTRAYGESAGGMERLSYELIQAVSRQPNIQTQVIFHKSSRGTSPLFNFTALPKALAAAKQADIIHIGDPILSFLGWILKKFTKKPVAITVHGLDILYPNFFYQLYLKLFFQNFDLYLPISNYVKSLLKKDAVVMTPGFTDRFYDANIKKQKTDKKVLFTSGRLVKRKGHEWFIKEILPKLPGNVEYMAAGKGPSYTLEVSEGKRVRFLGRISDEQLQYYYNTADAFIMPNIPVRNDVEGFGLVLLEAASCNLPVFAANIDGIPDAIHDGKNGTLLPAQDTQAWIEALTSFLKNPPESYDSRDYTLENFSWSHVAPVIAKSLSALARGRSASESKRADQASQE